MGASSHISTTCTILVYDPIEHAFTSVMIPLGGVSTMRGTLKREHVALDEKSWIC